MYAPPHPLLPLLTAASHTTPAPRLLSLPQLLRTCVLVVMMFSPLIVPVQIAAIPIPRARSHSSAAPTSRRARSTCATGAASRRVARSGPASASRGNGPASAGLTAPPRWWTLSATSAATPGAASRQGTRPTECGPSSAVSRSDA